MHTKPDDYDPHGISVVHESMIALNQIIVNSMIKRRNESLCNLCLQFLH